MGARRDRRRRPGAELPTTYAGALPAARIADIAAGLLLIVAGWLALAQAHARRVGVLALLAGIAWFGPDLEGWERGPALLRSLGAVVAPFAPALTLHLVALPAGRLRSPPARAATLAAYGIAAVVSAGGALLRDPLLDLYCWRNCRDSAFLVAAEPGIAHALARLWLWAALAIALSLIAFGGRRLRNASDPARRVLFPALGPAMLVGAGEGAYAVALLRVPLEDPTRTGFAAIFLARSIAFAMLALGVAWSVLRVLRTRARVAPVELDVEAGARPPAAVETTAYVTVAEAIDDAHLRGAGFLSARVYREGGQLVIAVEDDGAPRSSRLQHLADRVGALGGALQVGATSLRAEIPCE